MFINKRGASLKGEPNPSPPPAERRGAPSISDRGVLPEGYEKR